MSSQRLRKSEIQVELSAPLQVRLSSDSNPMGPDRSRGASSLARPAFRVRSGEGVAHRIAESRVPMKRGWSYQPPPTAFAPSGSRLGGPSSRVRPSNVKRHLACDDLRTAAKLFTFRSSSLHRIVQPDENRTDPKTSGALGLARSPSVGACSFEQLARPSAARQRSNEATRRREPWTPLVHDVMTRARHQMRAASLPRPRPIPSRGAARSLAFAELASGISRRL
jgi:hypothetical protein